MTLGEGQRKEKASVDGPMADCSHSFRKLTSKPVKATHWSRLVKMNKVVCKFKKGNIKLNKIIIYITITL